MDNNTIIQTTINRIFKNYKIIDDELKESIFTILLKTLLLEISTYENKIKYEFSNVYYDLINKIIDADSFELYCELVRKLESKYKETFLIKSIFHSDSSYRESNKNELTMTMSKDIQTKFNIDELDIDIMLNLIERFEDLITACKKDDLIREKILYDIDDYILNIRKIITDREYGNNVIVSIKKQIPPIALFETKEAMVFVEYSILIIFTNKNN